MSGKSPGVSTIPASTTPVVIVSHSLNCLDFKNKVLVMADTLGAWNLQHCTEKKLECYYTAWVGWGWILGSERFFSGFQPLHYKTALLHP